MLRYPVCLICQVALCAASLVDRAGPPEHAPRLQLPQTLNLALPQEAPPTARDPSERVPAAVISPVFQSYAAITASSSPARTLRTENPEELANEQMAREIDQRAYAASVNSGACVTRSGGGNSDAVGAGVRWSLNSGFGFYWQGKGMRDLQRVLGLNELNNVCPPGDPNPMCRTMPRQACN